MPWEKGQSGHPGGPYSATNKPFRDALRMELAKAEGDHRGLRAIAANLIKVSLIPETSALPAIKEVADRTDGKVPQAVGGTDELPPQQHHHTVERIIVDPKAPDTDSEDLPPAVETGPI